MTLSLRSPASLRYLALTAALAGLPVDAALAEPARPKLAATVQQFHRNFSAGKVELNGALVDDAVTVTVNGPDGFSLKGRTAFVAWLKDGKTAFPDMTITDHDVVAAGNIVAVRFTVQGTHTGPLQTPDGVLQATGKKVRSTAAEFFTFNAAGKLIHLEAVEDNLTLLTQLKR